MAKFDADLDPLWQDLDWYVFIAPSLLDVRHGSAGAPDRNADLPYLGLLARC
jgi:hypothetical protein